MCYSVRRKAATSFFRLWPIIAICCRTVHHVVREKSVELVQYMESHLLRTLVVTIPLLSAVITQSTGTPVSLEISQLLVQRFLIQSGLVRHPSLHMILSGRKGVASLLIPRFEVTFP